MEYNSKPSLELQSLFNDESFLKSEDTLISEFFTSALNKSYHQAMSEIEEEEEFTKIKKSIKPLSKKISQQIVDARLKLKLSREEASRRMNISKNELSNYENGKAIPKNNILKKINTHLKCNIPYR